MTTLEQTIYIDILLLVNLFVNYFILLAVAKFFYFKPKRLRIILGASLGSIYSLYIFLPKQGLLISSLLKITMAITIIIISFGIKKSNFFKFIICFCLINFAFSGLIFLMWITFKPQGVSFNNGIVYFNISPLMLIIFTSISYFLIEFINKFLGKHVSKDNFCHIKIKIFNKVCEFDAFIDTGNLLREPFSNLPVIVTKLGDISDVFPKNFDFNNQEVLCEYSKKFNIKFRLIPFEVMSYRGFIPAFRPDYIIIQDSFGESFEKEAYIAVCSDKNFEKSLVGLEILDN